MAATAASLFSLLFTAITTSLYYAFFVHRVVPLLSLVQKPRFPYFNNKNNHNKIVFNSEEEEEEEESSSCWDRPPPIWPHSLKSIQQRIPDIDSKVGPATTITYYDYDAGANLIQITPTPANTITSGDNDGEDTTNNNDVLWDLELNTGHSFYFTPATQTCKAIEQPVGILRPNWLKDAIPIGPSKSKWDPNRIVCGWTKLDFIDYYVDANTNIPESWYFHNMRASFRVLNYTDTISIDPSLFVPPEYCF